jgi:hypothetical protein
MSSAHSGDPLTGTAGALARGHGTGRAPCLESRRQRTYTPALAGSKTIAVGAPVKLIEPLLIDLPALLASSAVVGPLPHPTIVTQYETGLANLDALAEGT